MHVNLRTMDPARGCLVNGCDRKYCANGYCVSHNIQVSKHGKIINISLDGTRPPRFCKVEGCDRLHESKGYCRAHRNQILRVGIITNNKIKTPNGKQGCLLNYCDKKHKAQGYCQKHYAYLFGKPHYRDQRELTAIRRAKTRDNFTCQWAACGLTDKDTTVNGHHIFPKDRFTPKTIITYCKKHHKKWHEYNGDRNAVILLSI